MGLVVYPQINLLNDKTRIVAYVSNDRGYNENKRNFDFTYRFLHPMHAIILSLFNGQKSCDDVSKELAYLEDANFQNAQKTVTTTVNTFKDLLSEYGELTAEEKDVLKKKDTDLLQFAIDKD